MPTQRKLTSPILQNEMLNPSYSRIVIAIKTPIVKYSSITQFSVIIIFEET